MATGMIVSVKAAVVSHMGNLRSNNEDNFFFNGDFLTAKQADGGAFVTYEGKQKGHVFAVFDGMGGLEDGENASLMAAQGAFELYKPLTQDQIPVKIEEFAVAISNQIWQSAKEKGQQNREGTTMAVLLLEHGKAYVAGVGDSRVYLFRGKQFHQLSVDHSPLYKQVLQGTMTREQARKHPRANAISQFLGMKTDQLTTSLVNQYQYTICEGDRYVVCSDGLSDLLPHERIAELLEQGTTPENAVRLLINEALEMGGKDNVTVMVCDVSGKGLPTVAEENYPDAPRKLELDTDTSI